MLLKGRESWRRGRRAAARRDRGHVKGLAGTQRNEIREALTALGLWDVRSGRLVASFGAGPRVCICSHFALLEGPLVLATLMREARVFRHVRLRVADQIAKVRLVVALDSAVDDHAELVEFRPFEGDDGLAVVSMQVLALAIVVQQPMAIAEVDFTSDAMHGVLSS